MIQLFDTGEPMLSIQLWIGTFTVRQLHEPRPSNGKNTTKSWVFVTLHWL